MRLFLLLVLATLALGLRAKAQTYFETPNQSIPNDGAWHFFNIPVSNADQDYLDSTFGLARVCLDISHPEVSDLTIRLGAPTPNSDFILADLTGTRGPNFTNTCFSMRATRSVMNGSSPFTGTYYPQEFFSRVNRDSLPANGTWYVAVKNTSASAAGTFNGVSITLQSNPPPDPSLVPLCGLQNPTYCRCPDGSDTCDLLPDVTASTLILQTQNLIDGDSLRFSNATPNIGWGPMEVHGTAQCYCDTTRVPCTLTACPNGAPPKENVIQRIYRREGGTMTYRDRPMGYMQYHPSHGHVHVEGWSLYTLRVRNQSPDPLLWPIVAASGKRSYCLTSFGDCSTFLGYCADDTGGTLDNSDIPNFGFGIGTSSGCGRDQGIFVASIDIYATNTPGQAISLAGLCGGDFYIVSETDPGHIVEEMTHGNNVAYAPVRINRPMQGTYPIFDMGVGGSVYTLNATNIPAGATYVWDFGDGTPRDSTHNPTVHYYGNQGTYTVTLTYRGQPCGNTFTTQTALITSVPKKQPAATFALAVQPNPATPGAVITFRLAQAPQGRLTILNTFGQIVGSYSGKDIAPGENRLAVPTGLPRSMYTAVLDSPLGRAQVRFSTE